MKGSSTSRSPMLEVGNYALREAHIKAYIKSIHKRAWRAVLTGWEAFKMDGEN
ncbi:hypothetical protein J1N35_008077, partial [Gossypium stocksii]